MKLLKGPFAITVCSSCTLNRLRTESGPESDGGCWRCRKQAAIKEAFAHSWKGYSDYAWGMDELTPLTKAGKLRACPAARMPASPIIKAGQRRMLTVCAWASGWSPPCRAFAYIGHSVLLLS